MTRIVKYPRATTIRTLPRGGISVVYHNTEVVRIEKGILTLNSGGYRTATTKQRMNQYTPDNVSVYQQKGKWFVDVGNSMYQFEDKMRIDLPSLLFCT